MRRIHYGWVMVAVGLVTLVTAAGFRSTTGILIVPLQNEFGWSRALLSAAVSVNLVLYGLVGPFAAALMERFGIRRTVLASLALICTGASKFACCHPDVVSLPNVTVARRVPLVDHRLPTWVPVLVGPL